MVGSVSSIVVSYLAGVFRFFCVFSVVHCSPSRVFVLARPRIEYVFEDSDARLLVCIGLLIGTLRPIPGSCANQVIIFVKRRFSIAVLLKELVEHAERLL